jgi:hypothetical protein
MKAPLIIVTAALTVAILIAASFLIATGTRGENALWLLIQSPADQIPAEHILDLPLEPRSISFDQKDRKAPPAEPTVP